MDCYAVNLMNSNGCLPSGTTISPGCALVHSGVDPPWGRDSSTAYSGAEADGCLASGTTISPVFALMQSGFDPPRGRPPRRTSSPSSSPAEPRAACAHGAFVIVKGVVVSVGFTGEIQRRRFSQTAPSTFLSGQSFWIHSDVARREPKYVSTVLCAKLAASRDASVHLR